jgi:hypothetical protein
MRGYRLAIVLPDIQSPHEDVATLGAVESYMADERWDYYVNLGDFLDFNCISRWTADLPRRKLGETIAKDYEHANHILDRHVSVVRQKNRKCEMALIQGNHDFRIEQHIDRFPELEGVMEVPRMLRLKERDIRWVPFWEKGTVYRIGKATFIHGRYTNKYHAAKHAMSYGTPVFYGHEHTIQVYTETLLGKDKTIQAASLGCLCDYDQKYMRGAPSNWMQAFGVFWFFPDGFFQWVVVPIFKHRFVGPTTGRVYST